MAGGFRDRLWEILGSFRKSRRDPPCGYSGSKSTLTTTLRFFLTQPAVVFLLTWNPLFCFLFDLWFQDLCGLRVKKEGLTWTWVSRSLRLNWVRGPNEVVRPFSSPGLYFLCGGFISGRFSTVRCKEASSSSKVTFHQLHHPSQKRAPLSHSSHTILGLTPIGSIWAMCPSLRQSWGPDGWETLTGQAQGIYPPPKQVGGWVEK